jgi:hypothetical protein
LNGLRIATNLLINRLTGIKEPRGYWFRGVHKVKRRISMATKKPSKGKKLGSVKRLKHP